MSMQVVGAGRGPLVQAALNAGATAGRPLKVYAVEKNANAIITLRNRAIMDKWTNVTIVAKDMREFVSVPCPFVYKTYILSQNETTRCTTRSGERKPASC